MPKYIQKFNEADFGFNIRDAETHELVGLHKYSPPYVPRDFDGNLVDWVGDGKVYSVYYFYEKREPIYFNKSYERLAKQLGVTTMTYAIGCSAEEFKNKFDLDHCEKESEIN